MPLSPASSRGGSGGVGTTVATTTLGSAQNAIDVTAGFPASYTTLVCYFFGRVDTVATTDLINITFNGDGGAHYNVNVIADTGGAAVVPGSSVNNASFAVNCNGASAAANFPTQLTLICPGAGLTTFFKAFFTLQGMDETGLNTGTYEDLRHGTWQGTAAISRVTFTAAVGKNFITGSTLQVIAY